MKSVQTFFTYCIFNKMLELNAIYGENFKLINKSDKKLFMIKH